LTPIYYLDIYNISLDRFDDHPGKYANAQKKKQHCTQSVNSKTIRFSGSRRLGTDCLHFCGPTLHRHSTLSEWNRVLITALANLADDARWRNIDLLSTQSKANRHPKHHPLSEFV
jgi:hypothetical protein